MMFSRIITSIIDVLIDTLLTSTALPQETRLGHHEVTPRANPELASMPPLHGEIRETPTEEVSSRWRLPKRECACSQRAQSHTSAFRATETNRAQTELSEHLTDQQEDGSRESSAGRPLHRRGGQCGPTSLRRSSRCRSLRAASDRRIRHEAQSPLQPGQTPGPGRRGPRAHQEETESGCGRDQATDSTTPASPHLRRPVRHRPHSMTRPGADDADADPWPPGRSNKMKAHELQTQHTGGTERHHTQPKPTTAKTHASTHPEAARTAQGRRDDGKHRTADTRRGTHTLKLIPYDRLQSVMSSHLGRALPRRAAPAQHTTTIAVLQRDMRFPHS